MHKAKKSLGQNFLKSEAALHAIIQAGEITEKDTIVEIGPGKGALTERLLEKAGKVVAIEKDKDLLPILEEKFNTEIEKGKLVIVNQDVLECNLENFVQAEYKVIANIPYNITGAILKKFLAGNHQPGLMVLLVQKEVALRIVARDLKESILSISVKTYGMPTYIMKVAARYFSPAPKVDSAVIKIANISKDFFHKNNVNEENFWSLIHAGFAHKRKMLAGNLKTWRPDIDWGAVFATCRIPTNTRAEDIGINQWVSLYKNFE
ncbi:MAG: 16S rRNA (adenine(1518)-N(6)/adenine(1519)-N(6))-dimethyltransferase RsmA [Candidatus Paceibacteria bacterium]